MTTASQQGLHALPETCIRGPELDEPVAISAEIRGADRAALLAYHHGVELLLTARRLLDSQTRLQELVQTRAFLVRQLETLEQQHPNQFAAALATYDRWQATRTTTSQMETNGCTRTTEADCPCEPPHPAVS